ncbi:MAG TPA: helix-turn-helix domain-containing protein [Thermoplasmata archaeon]|jgi:predicted DNA binding protein
MIEAELVLEIPKMWITEMPKRHGVSISILDRRPAGKTGVRDLVEISGGQSSLEKVREELEDEPWVESFDLDLVEPGKLVGEVVTHRCLACAAIAGSNCYLVSAKARKDGTILWRVMTSDRDEVRKLVAKLRKAKCSVELVKLTPIDEREVLTSRQKEVIMMAFERGFFETPRKVKLKDLSRLTGVSQATLSEVLRKGQKKIVVDYLSVRRNA